MTAAAPPLRPWDRLDEAEQTRLRIAFGHYLDGLPPTCSLEVKDERFRAWLQTQGVDYPVQERPSRLRS